MEPHLSWMILNIQHWNKCCTIEEARKKGEANTTAKSRTQNYNLHKHIIGEFNLFLKFVGFVLKLIRDIMRNVRGSYYALCIYEGIPIIKTGLMG